MAETISPLLTGESTVDPLESVKHKQHNWNWKLSKKKEKKKWIEQQSQAVNNITCNT